MLSTTVKNKATTVPSYAWIVLGVVFLASVAAPLNQFKVPPLLPVLMETFRLNLSQAGLLMSVFAFTGLVLALPAGLILQKLGPKMAGVIAVGCLVIGSAWGALTQSASWLLASRVLEGVGMGLIGVVAPAAIALWFPRQKQGLAMGIWGIWVPLGNVIMYILAPTLAAGLDWQAVWWVGAGFSLVALVLYGLFMRLPPKPLEAPIPEQTETLAEPVQPLGTALRNRNIWLLALAFACFNYVIIGFATFFPTFLAEARAYSLAQAGLIASLPTLVTLGSAPLAGWLSDRIGSRRWFFTMPFLVIAGTMIFPFHLTGWTLYALMVLLGLVAGAIPIATFAAVPEVMNYPRWVGMGLAVIALGMNLGIVMGPILLGMLVETVGWVQAGYSLIPICLLGFAAGWLVKLR